MVTAMTDLTLGIYNAMADRLRTTGYSLYVGGREPTFPFFDMEIEYSADGNGHGSGSVTVHAWSRSADAVEAITMLAAAHDALDGYRADISGGTIALSFDGAQPVETGIANGSETRHGAHDFNLLVHWST